MASRNAALQIGEVSKKSKASIHTIRYYEKMGLLKKPVRSSGGFRLYSPETVERLLFIQKAQKLGLTLREIEKITCCGDKGLGPCCDLTTGLFSQKIIELETKIDELEGMKSRLKQTLGGWVKKSPKRRAR